MAYKVVRKDEAFIRFKNHTGHYIKVFCINLNNKENIYFGILGPTKCMDVNTYSTHSWIFRECMSDIQMVVEGKKVFTPTSWLTEHASLPFYDIERPIRKEIIIHSPVLDLKQMCLFSVASTKDITKNDIIRFEIPVTLQTVLIQMIIKKPTN